LIKLSFVRERYLRGRQPQEIIDLPDIRHKEVKPNMEIIINNDSSDCLKFLIATAKIRLFITILSDTIDSATAEKATEHPDKATWHNSMFMGLF